MEKLTKLVNQTLSWLIIAISATLLLCVVWQVVSRYILGTPSTVTDEMARFLFMWVGLLGAAYATGQKRHLAIDLLTMRLRGQRKLLSELVVLLAMGGFAALVMVYGGMNLVNKTLSTGQISPSLGLPMGYVYLCLPVSGLTIVFYCVSDGLSKVGQLMMAKA
ncbi:TRAP transporter small permease [Oceanimonas marisflavi]|uniref:TRAP transporter small permease n=1 Tax=Oceanimonas marisflavi TaxID=2059724 RepID=UPI000D2FB31E|nr:TRAP transporter small permease [Oceanimonas marisflavi]